MSSARREWHPERRETYSEIAIWVQTSAQSEFPWHQIELSEAHRVLCNKTFFRTIWSLSALFWHISGTISGSFKLSRLWTLHQSHCKSHCRQRSASKLWYPLAGNLMSWSLVIQNSSTYLKRSWSSNCKTGTQHSDTLRRSIEDRYETYCYIIIINHCYQEAREDSSDCFSKVAGSVYGHKQVWPEHCLGKSMANLCNSLHHIISISRRVLSKRQTLCLHFGYSSCSQRLIFRSIRPGSMSNQVGCWMSIPQRRPLCIVFTNFTSGAERIDANRCKGADVWCLLQSCFTFVKSEEVNWCHMFIHFPDDQLISEQIVPFRVRLNIRKLPKIGRFHAWCQPILCGLCFHFVIPWTNSEVSNTNSGTGRVLVERSNQVTWSFLRALRQQNHLLAEKCWTSTVKKCEKY